MLITTQTH